MTRHPLLAVALSLTSSIACADKIPVAVLWLDGPRDAAAAIESGLAASKVVRSIDDAEARRALVEGGASARIATAVATARDHFAAGRCPEADAILAEAEERALTELFVASEGASLGEIESLRLLCADLSRDDAAATRAARLLSLAGGAPSPMVAAAMARHPSTASGPAPAVRVESDPAGATVYVDLRAVGVTPLDLPADRADAALIDLELDGYRKVHRAAPPAGTLSAAMSREDRLGPLVDHVSGAKGDAPEGEVAALGRRVGAARVMVVRIQPGRSDAVQARVLDVATGKWAKAAVTEVLADAPTHLASYAAPSLEPAKAAPAAAAAAPPKKADGFLSIDTTLPAWKRWYTWVAGGVLLAGVVGLVVAYHVGSDQVTLTATH